MTVPEGRAEPAAEGEAALIKGIREGDEAAFQTAFRLHAPRLLAFVARRFGGGDAESVVQDVFAKIWDQRASLAIRVSLRALLYRAARNRMLDLIKRGRVEVSCEDPATLDVTASGVDAQGRLESDELRLALRRALASLPERARQVLDLRLHHGLKNREIAEVMDISLKAVEAHRARALGHLRILLAPWADGG